MPFDVVVAMHVDGPPFVLVEGDVAVSVPCPLVLRGVVVDVFRVKSVATRFRKCAGLLDDFRKKYVRLNHVDCLSEVVVVVVVHVQISLNSLQALKDPGEVRLSANFCLSIRVQIFLQYLDDVRVLLASSAWKLERHC